MTRILEELRKMLNEPKVNLDKSSFLKTLNIIFKDPLFLTILFIKIILSFLFISDNSLNLYLPFIKNFSDNFPINSYQYFFENYSVSYFSHPPLMLIISSISFMIFSLFSNIHLTLIDIFLFKIPLLISVILILVILLILIPNKKKEIILIYWLSPIIIYVNYIHGELHIISILLLLFSFYFLFLKRNYYSSIFLGLSLATKTGVLLIMPFFYIYMFKKKYNIKEIFTHLILTFLVYIIFIIPFASRSLFYTIYNSESHFKIFDLYIDFSNNVFFYFMLALYAYFLFKAFSFHKITKRVLLMITGVIFTLLVTLIAPPPSWYILALPFIAYFFIINKSNKLILYFSFNFLFLIYLFLVPYSEVFRVFQIISPKISNIPNLYNIINDLGLDSSKILSISFTLLTANLFYISYLMYNYGVKSSLLFQQKEGIPLIGISGDSGSGKTTVSKIIAKMFGLSNTNIICGDDVHKWERQDKNWENFTHVNPISNEIHLHCKQIESMNNKQEVLRRKYDHKTGKFTSPKIVKSKDYIIDEGLHTFMINNKKIYDLKIYMDPEMSLKIYWKINRDVKQRGYSKEQVISAINKRKIDSEKYVSPQKNSADLIFSFRPQKDIEYFINENGKIYYYLEILLKSDINIDPLIRKLEKISGLEINSNYPDVSFRRIIIKNNINSKQIINIIKNLDMDYSEYEIKFDGILDNNEGLIQLFSLYCLNERLNQKYDSGENNAKRF